MTKAVFGSAKAEINNDTDTISVTWPASITANHFAVLTLSWYYESALIDDINTNPTDFDARVSEVNVTDGTALDTSGESGWKVWTKDCAGGETGSVSVVFGGNVYASLLLVVYSGDGDLSYAGISAGGAAYAASTTSAVANSYTATAGDLIVAAYALSDAPGADTATPSGMTLADQTAENVNPSRQYYMQAAGGATGTKTYSWTTSRDAAAVLVAASDAGASTPKGRMLMLGVG